MGYEGSATLVIKDGAEYDVDVALHTGREPSGLRYWRGQGTGIDADALWRLVTADEVTVRIPDHGEGVALIEGTASSDGGSDFPFLINGSGRPPF